MEAAREAFEKWVRKMFVCSEHSFVRAHPYGYINTVSSQTFEGRVQPSYADVQMLWETWLGRAAETIAETISPAVDAGKRNDSVHPTNGKPQG